MPKYIVHVNEVHRVGYIVEAEDEDSAIWNVVQLGDTENMEYSEFGYMIEDDVLAELVIDPIEDEEEEWI